MAAHKEETDETDEVWFFVIALLQILRTGWLLIAARAENIFKCVY